MAASADPGPSTAVAAPRTISREVARRYLAIHHFLSPPRSLPSRPDGVLAVFDRLGSIQFDPIEIAGRNHDLVLLARVAGYRREMTDRLLYDERSLFETYNKGLSLVPTAELPWYRIAWDRARLRHEERALDEHAALVDELLDRIRTTAPMSSTDIAPRGAIEWYWRPTHQVRAILEALAEAGTLGIARREGNRRVYDLVERLFPAELLERVVPPREAFRHKLLSRYRAHGLLGRSRTVELWLGTSPRVGAIYGLEGDLPVAAAGRRVLHAELVEAGALIPATIEDVCGERYLPAEGIPLLAQAEREVVAGDPPGGAAPGVAFLGALIWDAISSGPCSTSTTSGRSTSRRRIGAGATTSCRSCSGIGSSAGSSHGSSARRTSSGSPGCGGRTGSTRWPRTASSRRSPQPSRPIRRSARSTGWRGRERLAIDRS